MLKKKSLKLKWLKKMKKQLSDSEEKLKKVTTEKDAANAAKDTLQLKYDILLGQNKKIEKECDELKGELKNMRKEARTGFPSQQQPDSSLQQLVAKEQVKLHMYEKKKAIERDDKKKADRQKQKQLARPRSWKQRGISQPGTGQSGGALREEHGNMRGSVNGIKLMELRLH